MTRQRHTPLWLATALGALLVSGCGSEAAPKTTAAPSPAATSIPTLKVGETATYDLSPGIYDLTLKGVQWTADGVVVTWLDANNDKARADVDLNKEYLLTAAGERTDDVAVAGDDAISDPSPGQHKTIRLTYDVPKGYEGSIVYVAYDGSAEYDAFAVAVP